MNQNEVVLGVDTHLDKHVGAVISVSGKLLATQAVETTTSGYLQLLAWNGCPGSTIIVYWSRSAISRHRRPKQTTIVNPLVSQLRPDLTEAASSKPGAVHPGGDPTKSEYAARLLSRDVEETQAIHSAHTNGDWESTKGEAPHQRRVRELCEAAGKEPRDVFCTNAFFFRTRSADEIENPRDTWRNTYWPIHRAMLGVILPKVIVALGNGKTLSSYSLLREIATSVRDVLDGPWRDGKIAEVELTLDEGLVHSALLIGVPHPSRFVVPQAVCDRLRQESRGWKPSLGR